MRTYPKTADVLKNISLISSSSLSCSNYEFQLSVSSQPQKQSVVKMDNLNRFNFVSDTECALIDKLYARGILKEENDSDEIYQSDNDVENSHTHSPVEIANDACQSLSPPAVTLNPGNGDTEGSEDEDFTLRFSPSPSDDDYDEEKPPSPVILNSSSEDTMGSVEYKPPLPKLIIRFKQIFEFKRGQSCEKCARVYYRQGQTQKTKWHYCRHYWGLVCPKCRKKNPCFCA